MIANPEERHVIRMRERRGQVHSLTRAEGFDGVQAVDRSRPRAELADTIRLRQMILVSALVAPLLNVVRTRYVGNRECACIICIKPGHQARFRIAGQPRASLRGARDEQVSTKQGNVQHDVHLMPLRIAE